jgi:hypothetical protein
MIIAIFVILSIPAAFHADEAPDKPSPESGDEQGNVCVHNN